LIRARSCAPRSVPFVTLDLRGLFRGIDGRGRLLHASAVVCHGVSFRNPTFRPATTRRRWSHAAWRSVLIARSSLRLVS
jgi:hypothetical protein